MKRFSKQWIKYHFYNNRLSLWIKSSRFQTIYMVKENDILEQDIPYNFSINTMDHIKSFQETERWHDYHIFVSKAEENIAAGNYCITYVENNILSYCGWIACDAVQSKFSYIGQTVKYPPKTVTSYSVYTHPLCRGKGLGREAAKFVVKTFISKGNQNQLVAAVDGNNIPAHRFHLSAGFERIAVLYTHCLMGRKKYRLENIQNSFGAILKAYEEAVWILDNNE